MASATSTLSRGHGLLWSGKYDEAVTFLAIAIAQSQQEPALWHLLSVAETQRRRHADALKAIKRALALEPGDVAYQQQYGFVLANLRRFNEAVDVLLPVLHALPDDYATMRALQIAYYHSGKQSHAIALGRKLLRAEDVAVMKMAKDAPAADLMPFARGNDRVISFSLPGASSAATIGAFANVALAQSLYPGWKCRFYVGGNVPSSTKAALRERGAEVVEAAESYPGIPPALWPYLVADDPGVGVFLCRNCTSRPSAKEASAVNEWLSGGKRAHVMRDHVLHRNLVLPGMWGARTETPLFISARIERFTAAHANPPYGLEQRFLDGEIWPAIREDCVIHDSHYDLFGARPFPDHEKGDDQYHVGVVVTAPDVLRREAQELRLSAFYP